MIYNYHTHTARCGHASGTVEEYIKKAIDGGIEYLGFSDHVPYMFPDGYESDYRVPVAEGSDYVKEIKTLRTKYKDYIDIKIGFEMEYYPVYFEDMLEKAINYGAEYLILGEHFINNEHPNGFYVNFPFNNQEYLDLYAENVVEAIKSGVFTYVAHPDIIKYTGSPFLYEKAARKICTASKEEKVPLEINFLGIRGGRNYPNAHFWEIAGDEGAPVTFGFDAHSADTAYDSKSIKIANEMVKNFNLNYIGKPELRKVMPLIRA